MQRKAISNNPAKESLKDSLLHQDRLLQDALMQELAQKKMALENLENERTDTHLPLEKAPGSELLTETTVARPATLRDCVQDTLRSYFAHLDGQPVTHIYEMVLAEVEVPLLEAVMRYTQRNQCKAAAMLGISRGTLRKKLQQYDLL